MYLPFEHAHEPLTLSRWQELGNQLIETRKMISSGGASLRSWASAVQQSYNIAHDVQKYTTDLSLEFQPHYTALELSSEVSLTATWSTHFNETTKTEACDIRWPWHDSLHPSQFHIALSYLEWWWHRSTENADWLTATAIWPQLVMNQSFWSNVAQSCAYRVPWYSFYCLWAILWYTLIIISLFPVHNRLQSRRGRAVIIHYWTKFYYSLYNDILHPHTFKNQRRDITKTTSFMNNKETVESNAKNQLVFMPLDATPVHSLALLTLWDEILHVFLYLLMFIWLTVAT